jgi:hypothetical protein
VNTERLRLPLIAIVGLIASMSIGTSAASGVDRCLGAGGGDPAPDGCSRVGSAPTQDGECTQGTGPCYECEVDCPAGPVTCAEMDDFYPHWCCDEDGTCWGTDIENPEDDPPPPGDGDNQDSGNGTPILIDLDGDGFDLVGVNEGVVFDLFGNGRPGYWSWTRRGDRDAFLCHDRDGSGWIESGRELFGNATLLANGATASNGYLALRELDSVAKGGNGDGRITREDGIFEDLCVWVDQNHNGKSEGGEILALASTRVLELSVEFRESRRRDAHGNEFRYRASVIVANPSGRPRVSATYDVILVSRPAL